MQRGLAGLLFEWFVLIQGRRIAYLAIIELIEERWLMMTCGSQQLK